MSGLREDRTFTWVGIAMTVLLLAVPGAASLRAQAPVVRPSADEQKPAAAPTAPNLDPALDAANEWMRLHAEASAIRNELAPLRRARIKSRRDILNACP